MPFYLPLRTHLGVCEQAIDCRFGMAGIIAEPHYDSGRNFIAVIRGTRRYVLVPPTECGKLQLIHEGPSIRHAAEDWASPDVIHSFSDVAGVEVILQQGDVLYLPSLWFHYTINLARNIQVCMCTACVLAFVSLSACLPVRVT